MSGVTVGHTGSLAEMLELYSARLESLRADMLAVHEQVEALATDFRSVVETALAAEQPAVSEVHDTAFETLTARDPEIGSEIDILTDEQPAATAFEIEPGIADSDDLTAISGIDDTAAETLQGFGIDSYAALAAIDTDEATAIGMVLGDAERVGREGWVEQATAIATAAGTKGFGLDTTAVTLALPPTEKSYATAMAEASDGPEIATSSIPVAIDPVFEDIVIEQDETTRQLILAAATLAKTVAAEKERERADALGATAASLTAAGEKPAISATVIDFAERKAASQHRRRPRAIAASLVALLIAGIAVGAASDQFLGFDPLSTVASCGEALLHGNTGCLELPASF